MTKDDIIPSRTDVLSMAREAGMEQDGDNFFSPLHEEMDVHISDLERFAALIASRVAAAAKAEEREACAQICDSVNSYDNPMTANDVADAIRARGNNDS